MTSRIVLECECAPNLRIIASARRIGTGEFAGFYRGHVATIEHSAWLTPCVNRWPSEIVRATRASAMADAIGAAKEAGRTGFVPAF